MPRSAAHPSTTVELGDGRRMRARRGEGERLRDEILVAAGALLAETGDADKVSMRAVAQRVGCTSPALYLHFPDKAALMYCVCERQFDQLSEILAAAVEGVDDPTERLRVVMRSYVHFALEHPEQYRVMLLEDTYSANYQSSLEELGASAGFHAVVQAVEDGIAAGTYAPTDPLLTGLMLWAHVHGLVSLMLVKRGLAMPDPEDLIALAVDQQLNGLLARPVKRSRATR